MPHSRALLACAVALASCLVPARAFAAWPTTASTGGLAVTTAAAAQWYEQAVSDSAGGVIVAWRDDRHTAGGDPYNFDVYAQRIDATGTRRWGANDLGVCTDLAGQDRPALASDGAGGAYVAWSDLRSGNGDVYAQAIGASGAARWVANGVRVSRAQAYDWNAVVVGNGAAGCFVVWQADDATLSPVRRLYAQRYDANGAALWPIGGVPVATTSGDQTTPQACADGAGGLLVGWLQAGAIRSMRVQRLSNLGAPQWGAAGVALSDTTHPANSTFHLWADGAGGAWGIVHDQASVLTPWRRHLDPAGASLAFDALWTVIPTAWVVMTTAPAADGGRLILATNGAYEAAQRAASDGSLMWSAHGAIVTGIGLDRLVATAIADDGAGGAVCFGTASDPLTFWREIRAQRVTADGTLAWSLDARPLANAMTGDQISPLAVPAGDGAIAVWQDQRDMPTTGVDLYAQWIMRGSGLGGNVTGVAPATGTAFALGAPWPSPARAGTLVRLAFTRPAGTAATFALYDVAGRCVRQLALGADEGRDGTLALSTTGLPPGLYLARMRADANEAARRIVVTE